MARGSTGDARLGTGTVGLGQGCVVAGGSRGSRGSIGARGGGRDAPSDGGRCSYGSEQMMSEMSFSGRDSIPQDAAALGAGERRNTRVKRAVRISSIVAQEVRSPGQPLLRLFSPPLFQSVHPPIHP